MKSALIVPVLFFAAGSLMLQGQPAAHGAFFTAPYGPGGTWNLYQTNNLPMTWVQAQTFAESTIDPLGNSGKRGHIATVSSAAENMLIYEKVLGSLIWIGLTDHEKWGGREAGTDRKGGWRWVTGEPMTFTAWRSREPNDKLTTTEDAVAMEKSGRWGDWTSGADGQMESRFSSLIEWDTNSPSPVPGATIIRSVLPEKWASDLSKWTGPVRGTGPWTVFNVFGIDGSGLGTVVNGLQAQLQTMSVGYRIPRLNYHFKPGDVVAGGWTGISDIAPFQLMDGGCAALHVAKVHLDKPGTWSFNVHGDDYFAVRFPGLKWKSSSGLGGIDPSDPSTVFFSSAAGDGCVIGVIDLPAGDSTIEVLLGNRSGDTMIQILAAPEEITMDGGTQQWRVPGYKAGGDLAWPGVDSAGWKVTRAVRGAGDPEIGKLMDGLLMVESGRGKSTTAEGVTAINYIDSDAAGDIEFPDPMEYPGDSPGGQDEFAVKVSGTLVIPRDGIYHIGIHADDRAALRIIGQRWTSLVRNTGYSGKIEADTMHGENPEPNGTNSQLFGEISLKKGTYSIEAFYVNINGPSVLSIFGAPAGFAPRLIAKNGSKIEPDFDGIPLVASPE